MKTIKICEANRKKIEKVISEVEKRAKTRKLEWSQVTYAIKRIEGRLDIMKKDLDGVRADVQPYADRYPNAYKYTPEGTGCSIVNKKGAWYFLCAYRENCNRSRKDYIAIHLTEQAKQAVLERNERV